MYGNDLIMTAIKDENYTRAAETMAKFDEFFEQPQYKSWLAEHGGWVGDNCLGRSWPHTPDIPSKIYYAHQRALILSGERTARLGYTRIL